jgi:hypothetical protein
VSKKKQHLPDIFDFDYTGEVCEEWRGMPDFNQPNKAAYRQLIVSFENEDDVEEFFKLIDQSFTAKTKSIWFPDHKKNELRNLFIFDENTVPEDIKKNNEENAVEDSK